MTERNVLTGEVLKKNDDSEYYDPWTGTFKKRRDEDGLICNSLTGLYEAPVEKADHILPSVEDDSDEE